MNVSEIKSKVEEVEFKKRILIFLGVVLMGIGAYWYFVFNPKSENINNLKRDIENLESQIRQNKIKIRKLKDLEKKLKQKEKIFYYAKRLLPESNVEVENLLANIETLGNDVGIEFLLFQPLAEKKYDFYAIRTVTLKVRGLFPNLMLFLSHISNLNRLVTIDSLRLSPDKNYVLIADCKMSVYRSLTEEEIKAQEQINKGKRRR